MARIRTAQENERLIEVFAEVGLPNDGTSDPFILRTYPPDYSNKEILNNVPYFAYPCAFKCDVITHFSFVLTNINSKWTFGYCRHTPKSDTCLTILSDLPWHSTFYRILDHCAELMNRSSTVSLDNFLQALYNSDVPQLGLQLIIPYTMENIKLREFQVQCPDHLKLLSIPEDRNLSEYYNAVPTDSMITIFASMLNERRIVITSDRLNRLSACVQAANALIFPMQWQHIFIPLLPSHLLDYLSAPMPFLIGVPRVTLSKVKRNELGEVVLLNVDTNELSTPFEDVSTLPSDVLHSLRKSLKQSNNELGDGLCRSFMRALVSLIGGYHDALVVKPGQKIIFDRDKFVMSVRGTSRQLFLEKILQLQIFQQFIETRLEYLNRGETYIDEFELEVKEFYTNSSFRTQYKEWTATMKKEGSALLRAVPKMKTALSLSRQAVRNFYLMIQAPGNQTNYNGTNHRPTSAPSSPHQAPKMKKSISGTAISQTSRTVTYVRSPQPTKTFASSKGSRSTNSVNSTSGNFLLPSTSTVSQMPPSSSRKSSQSSSVVPAVSAESSDIEETDSKQMPRVDMSIADELESILLNKLPQNNSQSLFSTTKKETNKLPPIPPPRTDKLTTTRVPLRLPLTTSQALLQRSTQSKSTEKCLIEFDSPPSNNASNDKSASSLEALVFDPLFDNTSDGGISITNVITTSTSTTTTTVATTFNSIGNNILTAQSQLNGSSLNSKSFANYWETNNNFINFNGFINNNNNNNTSSQGTMNAGYINTGGTLASSAATTTTAASSNGSNHYQHLSFLNTPGLPATPTAVLNCDLLSLQARNQPQALSTAPTQAQSNKVSNPFNKRWQQFD